jgi:hypothetical protein
MYADDNNNYIHFIIRNCQHIYIRLALKYRQNKCKIVNKKLWQTKLKVINLDHIITDTFNRMITITEHNFLPNLIKMSFGLLKFDWI